MVDEHSPQRFGRLVWGVKESFRAYVRASGGRIETGGGGEALADGAFAFRIAPGGELRRNTDGELTGAARFLGEVSFEAHGGMLSVRLVDPAVEIGPAGATLTAADATGRRAEIARLDTAAVAQTDGGEVILPAALTLDGAFLLGDHYPPGAVVDPVRLLADEA